MGLPIDAHARGSDCPFHSASTLFRWGWSDYSRPGRYTHFVVSRKGTTKGTVTNSPRARSKFLWEASDSDMLPHL